MTLVACHDFSRRTCIEVERTKIAVKFVPLDVSAGLEVQELPAKEFDQRFTPMEKYPIKKACQLYLSYSQNIGATKEALEYLGQTINITKEEFDMATKKQASKTVAEVPKAKATKPVKAEKLAKAVTKPTAKPAKAPAKEAGKVSAAQMFKDLIMAGKLTDDQIFEKVQAEFGLDEKKRGYVKWYRNHLRKEGANPPEPK